jgi:tetratricopeptide (TPR) repeat protein
MAAPPNIPQRKPAPNNKLIEQKKEIDTLLQQGIALQNKGKLNEARTIFEKIITIDSNHFDALHLLGVVFAQIQSFQLADEFLSKALTINPNHSACSNNRGNVLKELKRFEEALSSYDKAISIKPDNAEAYFNRGIVLQELKRFEEALSSFDKAISIKADYANAYLNRGLALQELKRFDEALSSYDKAISVKADYAEAYSNRGLALTFLKRFEEALSSYDKAISIKPDYANAYWNLSLYYLLNGNLIKGWQCYEWRWHKEGGSMSASKRNFPQPLWLGGEPLKDKTILIYFEQGFGDTIQFCRYVPLVAALGAKVIFEVQPQLLKLLSNLEGVSQIIARGDPLPHFDYQCPLMSLPLAFKTELDTIPAPPQKVEPDKDKVIAWEKKLGEKKKLRVGIVWSGSTANIKGRHRSLPLSALIAHLPSDYDYVSLQKEICDADKLLLTEHHQIRQYSNDLKDFTDTAALIELMDVVISVDTSVAHLSATLGKSTWMMLPFAPDWRWLLDIDDSPWYSSVKLYRQEKTNDWHGVLEKIKSDLKLFR